MATKKKLEAEDMLQSVNQTAAAEVLRQATEEAEATTPKPPKKKRSNAGRPVEHMEPYTRLCTQIPESTRRKMEEAAFELSSPGHLVTFSELLIIWANEDEKRRKKRNSKK